MKKILSKIITFLFVIGIAVSGIGGNVYASGQNGSRSAGADVSITKERLSGSDRIETSLKISQNGWKNGADTVVIAQGYGYADALCATPLAKKYNAPIILSRQDALGSDTIAEIKRLNAKKAFVIGGEFSLSDNVIAQLKDIDVDTERIGGLDRYETSVEIARKLGDSGDISNIVVASGAGYADSLSMAPIAAAKGWPILLTESDSLPEKVESYIKSLNIDKTYVLGGTEVITTGLENFLPNPQRLGGTTRFDTNLDILQNFKSDLDFSNVYIAAGDGSNGDEFADALSGGVLASRKSAPLVLIYKTVTQNTADFITRNMSDKTVLTALGGTLVVPDAVPNAIESLYNGENPNEGIGPVVPVTPVPDGEHVSLVIDGYKGNIVNKSNLSFNKGDTVFDVLKKTLDDKGIPIYYEGTGSQIYVQSINGQREFDRPRGGGKSNQSGWKYSVNGNFPEYSCGDEKETLHGGESIHWIYVLGANDTTCFRDVDSVKLNKSSLDMDKGDSETLSAAVSPSDATDKNIVWSSSDESVATVDDDGQVEAVGSGTAAITAESIDNTKGFKVNYDASDNEDVCDVTVSGAVNPDKVTGVTLNKSSTDLEVGKTEKLEAAVAPSNAANKKLTWSSSDDSIASVNSDGLVTGEKAGTAVITVKTSDGGKTDTCTVKVKDKSPGKIIQEVHEGGLDLTISQGTDKTVNIYAKSENTSDDITFELYDGDGNLAYIDQSPESTGIMDSTTVLAPGKYHGYIRSSSTSKIEIPEFMVE
ncbi:cell wall-binding repeat-containing protein [uncultured Clostridium sp.]|uniref:cell wall-binding repeat-containing protein n=1 Tax=uncultured Clostridium sp. TaxID=59620 RepID=UPI0025E77EF7|nr:cell wall-binding repeat-containing protein [uncultured Clostridium sp.]